MMKYMRMFLHFSDRGQMQPYELTTNQRVANLAPRILRNSSIKPILVGAAIMHLQLITYRFGPV
jgi:hypothetical protein